MKILLVCHRFPYPPRRGGKIRPFNIARHLNQSHEVTVISLVRSEQEANEGKGIADYCDRYIMVPIRRADAYWRMLLRLFGQKPISFGYFFSPELSRRITTEVESTTYDLIFVHCSSVAPYVEKAHGPVKILDFGDMDSQKWRIYGCFRKFPVRRIYKIEGERLEREEKRLAAAFDYCTCTTKHELATLKHYEVQKHIDWFPNGVDPEAFSPSDEPYDPTVVSFIGRMDYFPNQDAMRWFCAEILPLLKQRIPEAQLWIVGADPSSEILRLAEIPGVRVTGSVEDVRPFVRRSAVNVAPLRIARGTQNKILEAMAMGVPVVTSAEAIGGVDAVANEHLLQASTPEEYVEALSRIMEDPKERKRLAEAGRNRVLERHNWSRSMEKLDLIIARALNKGQRSEGPDTGQRWHEDEEFVQG